MGARRIFIAIDISEAARRACSEHIDALRRQFRDVRVGWEQSEKLHITLKFLGDTDPFLLPDLVSSVSDIAARFDRFTLRLTEPGVFPGPSRPRILWAGVEDRANVSASLCRELEDVCGRFGFKGETRDFKPHVTIGRVRAPEKSRLLVGEHLGREIEPIEFEVAEIVMYESKLQPTGSIYDVVSKAKLRTD